jgi:hypothetical protein
MLHRTFNSGGFFGKIITGDYQCGFSYTRPATDQIFCILTDNGEKKWEYRQYIGYLYASRNSVTQSGENYCIPLSSN